MSNAVYANARAKALEGKLLGISRLNRMIDSLSAEEALKIVAEVGFGSGVSIDSATDFEDLITAENNSICSFIRECSPKKNIEEFLLLENDYKNAQAYIMAKHLKIDAENMTVPDGIYKKELLKDKISIDEYKGFTDNMGKALLRIDELFVSNNATGAEVNAILEKAKYLDLYNLSKKDKTLSNIYKVKADCGNITMALRSRDFATVKEFYFEGGTLSLSELKSLAEDSFDTIKDKFNFGERKEFILSAIEAIENNKPLSDFEKLADDYALKYLMKYKYEFSGNIPFILYVYYKYAELFNFRLIMVGLLNKFDVNDIKKRLRISYAG